MRTHLQKIILVVTYLSTSRLTEFCSLQGQSKFEGLTIFRNINHEGVDTVLVTVVGPCHHGMARHQFADRGMSSDKEGSCEYIE